MIDDCRTLPDDSCQGAFPEPQISRRLIKNMCKKYFFTFIFSIFIKSDRKRGREKQKNVYSIWLLIVCVYVYTLKFIYMHINLDAVYNFWEWLRIICVFMPVGFFHTTRVFCVHKKKPNFLNPAGHMFTFCGETGKIHHVVAKRHQALKESFQPAVAYLMCDARCPASVADDNCCIHGVCTEVVVFLTRDCCHHSMVLW